MTRYWITGFFFLVLAWTACRKNVQKRSLSSSSSIEITSEDIYGEIAFLASDSLRGRETGTAGEAIAATYIADHFEEYGLQPAGDADRYYQEFTVNMAMLNDQHTKTHFPYEERISRNVVGIVRGTTKPGNYVVIGAHYDHLGMGSFGSLGTQKRPAIHNGADDNASGTAGILELAQYFSKHPQHRSLVFIAFSAEEMGLLGSQYFVDHSTIPLDSVLAMINLDMIGRLNNDRLLIFGTGSSAEWNYLIEEANTDSLLINTIPDGRGDSDHTSFYNENIPVLHYFTDIHADYHRPTDDTEYINFDGEDRILGHVRRLVMEMDSLTANELVFKEAPSTKERNINPNGVTLQVMPDYSYSGKGMRITSLHENGPAGKAGLKDGDIIIRLAGKELNDIYTYMEVLNTLKKGDRSTVTVLRDDKEMTFDLQL